jgi:hypothetical protein
VQVAFDAASLRSAVLTIRAARRTALCRAGVVERDGELTGDQRGRVKPVGVERVAEEVVSVTSARPTFSAVWPMATYRFG